MPTCTDEERALLDAFANEPRADLLELSTLLNISRITPAQRERAVAAAAERIVASKAEAEAWKPIHAIGNTTKAYASFFSSLYREATARSDGGVE